MTAARGLDRWFTGVILGVAIVYALALPRMLTYLDPLTGDEPFYVMTAISLVRDRDVDETNNYRRGDYEEFYPPHPLPSDWQGWPAFPRPLPPHPATTQLDGLHTKHGLGLSLLIALPYALLGRVGAVLIVLSAAGLLAGQMYLLAREAGAGARLGAATAAGLALTMPIAPYAFLLFPEIPAALLLIFAIRRFSASSNTSLQWLLAGAAVGFLPWLHQRFAPTALALAVVALVRLARQGRASGAIIALIPIVAGGCLLLGYNLWLYRLLLQSREDHAGFSDLAGTLNGAFGLLLDAQWGLLIAAPIFLLSLVAAPLWLRASRPTALVAALAVTPYLALVAAYSVWWGEWGPPARYLVPVAPLAAGPLAALLRRPAVAPRVVAAGCGLWGAALTLIGLANPQRFYHHPDGWNQLVARLGELLQVDLAGRLVAFQPYAVAPRHERFAIALLLGAVCLALGLITYVAPNLRRANKPLSSPGARIVDV